jgi:hypothetical protein
MQTERFKEEPKRIITNERKIYAGIVYDEAE